MSAPPRGPPTLKNDFRPLPFGGRWSSEYRLYGVEYRPTNVSYPDPRLHSSKCIWADSADQEQEEQKKAKKDVPVADWSTVQQIQAETINNQITENDSGLGCLCTIMHLCNACPPRACSKRTWLLFCACILDMSMQVCMLMCKSSMDASTSSLMSLSSLSLLTRRRGCASQRSRWSEGIRWDPRIQL